MQNLRIVDVKVNDNSNIDIYFTEKLTSNLIASNISIISENPNTPSSEVLLIKVINNYISITCQPLTPAAAYFITLSSKPLHPFISINGSAKISEDGISNKYLITAPIESDNVVKNFFLSYFKENIYQIDDNDTVAAKYINSLSTIFSKALYDIRQIKNENYLSFTINDEQKSRSAGPFDRLNEEGAYEIIRVGRTPTEARVSSLFSFDAFPSYPITLQKQDSAESLKVNSIDEIGYFNINNFTLNLTNYPITKVNSIIFTLNSANPIYVYNISELGYQITNSRYDQNFAFSYLLLSDNQIKISDKILEDFDFSLDNIIRIDIQYEYKNLGKIIDHETIDVITTINSIREVLPPIINIFNLKYAPIVDTNNAISTIGGVVFTDPNNDVVGSKHPAFVTELPFRLNGLPFSPGQYSIDYSTGTVYVYGNNSNNDGTGPYPPLATYNYRFIYKTEQDYVYDSSLSDLVALPNGNLLNNPGNIIFNYEEVLIPGIDYKISLHQESLTERIGNNLVSANTIKSKNSPITNVFRIYNETSGEIYTIDRWNNDKIYFKYNTPPTIRLQVGEKSKFKDIMNELLFVNTSLTNNNSINIFKILLQNNLIISSTEDSIGSSFNTSLMFSNTNVFIKEKWFNRKLSETENINRLNNIGEYTVDYTNGIIYCAISDTQNLSIGTVSYKNNNIVPQFPHLISVDDIYYQTNILNPKNKKFTYTSFSDGLIIPELIENSDELSLNNNTDSIYQINDNYIGTFMSSTFVPGVTNQIKFIRSIYEYNDLINSTHPLNFAQTSVSSGFNIQVLPINGSVYESVELDSDGYYVTLDKNIPYISDNISYLFNVTRVSDSELLWNTSEVFIVGNPIKLYLTIGIPNVGDLVKIDYSFSINDISRIVVDYNRGDYFIDYTYILDEIIISYEYGDNVIDFRQNKNLPTNTSYYASYKVGALRDALLRNFGTLINIPELSNFDIDFNRERYRDALTAALTSFIQGPTVTAIKNIGKTISHIEPEIIESAFQNWSLGSSLLNPKSVEAIGSYQILPAKFDNGILINSLGQTITFPVNSNIRFEEGTFETWINPSWNGLDNDAELIFNILQDGYYIDPSKIFIGVTEYHPEIDSLNNFTLKKLSETFGTPNKNKDGIYIYYDKDISGNFKRWFIEVVDGYTATSNYSYKFKITSDGIFYDTKSIEIPKPSNLTIFTGTNTVNFNIVVSGQTNTGITFISDKDHYLLDFGKEKSKNRLSIFKDTSGYMNLKIFDQDGVIYSVSSDVSLWQSGIFHHIAASWKLGTRNNRDEIHLFIDGIEIPNIIRYGQRLKPYLHEKFRTVNPEEVIGLVNRDIVSSTDLRITIGETIVASSINFSAYNIFSGDVIFIDEEGFAAEGYVIVDIDGQTLTLSEAMPKTMNNGRFSINRSQFTIISDIDIYPNIAVSTIHPLLSGIDLQGISGSDVVTSTTDFSLYEILPGYLIRIDNSSTSMPYTILQINQNSITIDDYLPTNIVDTDFYIYSNTENEIPGKRALRPAYEISKDDNFNNILTISNSVFAGDLILIRTLGLNHRRIKKDYYVWSDGIENILATNLPPPISLDETKITKIILSTTSINLNNSTLVVDTLFSNNLVTYQPSVLQGDRSIAFTLSGTNIDFSSPVQITINGVTNNIIVSETIIFNDYGVLDFYNKYSLINYINVTVKPININKTSAIVSAKEKYSVTYTEGDGYAPVIRYSYQINSGSSLYKNDDSSVADDNNLFSDSYVEDYLVISSPAEVAGFYKINQVSEDKKVLFITPINSVVTLPLPSFSSGIYRILNVSDYRSGLQNGFFTFELATSPGDPYFLNSGFYELEYFTYVRIKFDPLNIKAYLGSDFNGNNQINSIMDQVKIYSTMLSDTRIGEDIPSNQRSITKDFNSLKSLVKDSNTLMLLDFNTFPPINTADFYTNNNLKKHFQSSIVVNENFGNSLVILDEPLVISNDGILNTSKEGSIEFWINPLFDTANDPNIRFYFDAFGAVTEETISVNNVSVKIPFLASEILSVKLKGGDSNIDYFAGGKLEIDTQNAISEELVSASNNVVVVSKFILQIISIKISGDLTGVDYFSDGTISSDMKTIYLGKLLPSNNLSVIVTYQTTENNNQIINTQIIRLNKKLPYQKSHLIVNYIPKGLQGDRLSIFKDEVGDINFSIIASGIEHVIKSHTRWIRGTWHRIKASYKVNGMNNTDEMRLFLDGYQCNTVADGYGIESIKFEDSINELFVGSQYSGESPIFSLIDNLRISNISRNIYAPYNEPIDINYNSNLNVVFPVTEDLFTTYLLNYNSIHTINDDFTILKNKKTGLFDFSVNIIDSLGIVSNSTKSKEALEKLIKVLKPANSRVFIKYIK